MVRHHRRHQPTLPMPRRLGRPETRGLREVVNTLLYIATISYEWRMLPKDFPPSRMGRAGTLGAHQPSSRDGSARTGGQRSPTAGVIDSQSVITTEATRGYDAGKENKDRKRHIHRRYTRPDGGLMVHGADVQDHDGAPDLRNSIRQRWP